MKKLIHHITDNPAFEQKFHGASTVFWFIAAFPICIFLSNSIAFVVFISVYAIVIGHFSSWQAAKAEKNLNATLETIKRYIYGKAK